MPFSNLAKGVPAVSHMQAVSPSDAALRRQLDHHVRVQKARLLATVVGGSPAAQTMPVTPAVAPLPAAGWLPTRRVASR